MLSEAKLAEVRACLEDSSLNSRVYIGCDSSRKRDRQDVWHATYTTAIVIHNIDEYGMGHGCRVFAYTETMIDYDQKKNRPMMRMMNEAYKAVEAYQQLELDLIEYDVEVHLDINDDEKHGSNCARSAAVGYAVGVTQRPVKTKPDAFAASYVADHWVRGKDTRTAVMH